MLDASPVLTTGPQVVSSWNISVTVRRVSGTTWPAVVLEGDEIVTTETEFVVYCGPGAPRVRLPRFLIPETTAEAIRREVWTPGIREEHRTNTGRRTHQCACQFGASWQCADGKLHHKCIYGRDSAMWNSPSPECVITWPDGKDAEFAEPIRSYTYNQGKTWRDHRAVVWLADRTCRSGCGCDCHADVLSRPPAPMSDEAAAWVREFVWTKRMRKAFADTPGAYLHCDCQFGPSGHCKAGKHTKCWHGANEPYRSPEAYVCGPDGTTVLSFAESFTHPTGSAIGPKRAAAAMVWLADRACRWRCPCDCHTSTASAPEPPPAVPEPRIDKPIQLDLFDALTA